MKISFKGLVGFILAAILCLGLWFKLDYPRLIFMDLKIDKNVATVKAQEYLLSLGADLKGYNKAVVFRDDEWADRYLQNTLGLEKEEEFLKKHNLEIFYWKVRFFKQYQKEEFVVRLSPVSGKILAVEHLIGDIDPRPEIGKEAAKERAVEFLKKHTNFNLESYDFHKEEAKRYENRTDYIFSWEKKGVYVPWGNNNGGAKLILGATVSGYEVREFYSFKLDIPESFERYLDKQLAFGQYLTSFSFLVVLLFIIWATYIVLKRRPQLPVKLCSRPYFYLAISVALVNILNIGNSFESIIASYPTSVGFINYLWVTVFRIIIGILFLAVAFVFPGLAGESLREEVLPEAKYSGLFHYIKSTFFSRAASRSIAFGYLIFIIMLGLQSMMFFLGQKYFGVWKEWTRFTYFSSAFLPFFTAFTVGLTASISEEVMFRVFGINWGIKYFKNVFFAVVFSALVWGFGHTAYAIFPIWFRGIEVSVLGIFLGWVYLRYGLIPLLIAHYLFDVFWGVASFISASSPGYLFYGSVFVLGLPLILSVVIYCINNPDKEKPIKFLLDEQQKYNLEILITFITQKKLEGVQAEALKAELLQHNWDADLVNLSIERVYHGSN